MMKRGLALLLCLWIAFLPAASHAGAGTKIPGFYKSLAPQLPKPKLPGATATAQSLNLSVAAKTKQKTASVATTSSGTLSSDTLPVYTGLGQNIASITTDSANNKMVVKQSAKYAIQDWSSFNIGSSAWVQFDQKGNTSWVALNRIFDQNPSQIFGKLTADGKVYLINQNGILFGKGSQVNVHTMTASSLNISDSDFMNGVLHFKAEDYQLTGNTDYLSASVINQGTINTDNLGSVFLLGPNIRNDGAIQTQAGQIGLAAGTDISLYQDTSLRNWEIVNVLQTAGDAVNNGQMTANTGLIGMYGKNVAQNGVIRAVAALKVDGEIELVASDKVSTGANSITATPISDSTETADQSFSFQGGVINIYGLDSSNPSNTTNAVKQVVHRGLIEAPSGTVTITAKNRVYLESGSSIDVSGVWIDKAASDNTTRAQLNGVNLRDYPDQKGGILKGKTITVDNHLGSSIGDISGSLTTQEKTALERSLQGGSIYITSQGDVIAKQGASLDFLGGGIRYTAGNVTTTALVSGNTVYDISNAPETLHYDRITTITKHVGSYVEGADAGLLSLEARKIVLDGNIQGAATAGVYQTRTSELVDTMGDQKTLGLKAPTGGTLIIGTQPITTQPVEIQDFIVDSVVLQSVVTPLPSLFGPDDQPYDPNVLSTTYLSTRKLSEAGLSNLQIAANTTLTVTADADISLNPGASLSLAARRIDFGGKINVPSGNVNLTVSDNVTSFPSLDNSSGIDNPAYVPVDSLIYLAKGSEIDAAGQCIDNSAATTGTGGTAAFTYIAGGSVAIQDRSYFGKGVISAAGSVIDVSGGYGINQKGVVTGGNAGTLSLQGAGIILDGDLKAYSLQGNNGGAITLHAQSITIAPSAPSNGQANLDNTLVLGQDRLDDTGFTQISLQSADNIVIERGVSISPSMVKLSTPVPGANNSGSSLTSVTPDLIGKSSFSVTAGSLLVRPPTGFDQYIPIPNSNATIQVLKGAEVNVAPGGSIVMKAPIITIDGNLNAAAGTVNIAATQADLTLQADGSISAAGYNLPAQKPVMQGLPAGYTPLSGGSVTLSAANGSVITQAGSLVDVSGSSPVTTYLLNDGGIPVAQTVASNPGSVTISANTLFSNGIFLLQGTLKGQARLNGLQGGTLSITSLSGQTDYTLSGSDLRNYLAGGFDALTLSSYKALVFSGPMDFTFGRSLTLDAPCFTDFGSDPIKLGAPSIQVKDTYTYGPGQAPETSSGTANLTLAGGWIDVVGAFSISGFQDVKLSAVHDLTFSDRLYGATWQGLMRTSADLTLQADRIYPTTLSDFTINSGGKITILGSGLHNSSPIYSAGGDLTILAHDIDMEGGYLAAPMGQISLSATGRVYLAEGSTISTAGSIAVNYGSLDDVFWTITDKANSSDSTGITVSSVPQKSVNITGSEVIIKSGSKIDVSGGGSIFAYQFQSGIEGTVDPLQTTGRYVIVPSGDYSLPGQAVYLEGAKGLKAGVYTLLPEQYAFLPGAIVITDTGATVTSGTHKVSADGYPLVAGYFTYSGTSIRPSLMEAFEVQPVKVVLKQGHFNTSTLVAGDAGSVAISGNTAVVDGTILAAALKGYEGGAISLSGANAFIEASTVQLPSDFNFDTPVTDVQGLAGTLHVAADSLSGKGFKEIDIGDLAVTDTITMEQGSILKATEVILSARNAITLESGAQIITIDSGGNGSASLITPNGLLTMQQNSLVHASDLVTMTIGRIDFQGDLQIDNGALNLTGRNVYFVPRGYSQSQTDSAGLYLPGAFWSKFGSFKDVELSASAGLVEFIGDISLSTQNSLTINAAAIKASNAVGRGDVVISAPSLTLLNTGGNLGSSSLQNVCSLSLNATEISVGEGALLLDGFAAVNLNAVKDIAFKGIGSFTTGGDLNFSSARITTSYYEDTNTPYTAASFQIVAGGAVTTRKSDGTADPTSVPGGTLGITARSIDHKGIVDVSSGYVTFTATGSNPGDGIFLRNGSEILARASKYNPGGNVQLRTDNGSLTMEHGALIDVHAPLGSQGDAGSITIIAPMGRASLQGTFAGASQPGGVGGSFSLDTYNIGDSAAFSSLYSMLGDFTESVDIRTRTGDLAVNTDVTAHHVQLTADSGNLDLSGKIDASNAAGNGSVELYAGQNLTVHNGSLISARGLKNGSDGGKILLSSTSGVLYLEKGATLDVSGGTSGQGGSVHFRGALSDGLGAVNMNLDGNISGAKEILAEGVLYGSDSGVSAQMYSYTGNKAISSQNISTWQGLIQDFMSGKGAAIQTGLFSNLNLVNCGSAQFVPGLEIRSTGTLTLNSAWDLSSSSWRYGADSVPGMLTLRAGGNLIINQNLVDHPTTSLTSLHSDTVKPSWGMTLVAGADLNGSDPSEFVRGTGNLTIANGITVYSESAPLRLAAGNDLTINYAARPGYMINSRISYNVGTYSGSISVSTGRDLTINGGAIQSATGDIDINVGRNLNLVFANSSLGTIRTTGESPNAYSTKYWKYGNGGDIAIYAAGNLNGQVLGYAQNIDLDGWDSYNMSGFTSQGWSASYIDNATSRATQGLATMAGGNLTVYAGGTFSCQAGTFGRNNEGNLTIFSGGDMKGRFLIADGTGELHSMGNFGSTGTTHLPIELFTATLNVTAQGNIDIGAIVNPTIVRPVGPSYNGNSKVSWDLEYAPATSVSLASLTGDVSLYGDDSFYGVFPNGNNPGSLSILPPTVAISAAGDINLLHDFTLAPYALGNLSLVAGRDINGQLASGQRAQIYMSEMSDALPGQLYNEIYGPHSGLSGLNGGSLSGDTGYDPAGLLHAGDETSVVVSAGRDISNLELYLPKKADITAGRDIRDIYYSGHNNSADDVTIIKAVGNIVFSSHPNAVRDNTGIQEGGPGALVVEAGLSMDLGTTAGIQVVGNTYDPSQLSETGCTLIAASGYSMDFSDATADAAFFKALQDKGTEYSKDMAAGDIVKAKQVVADARADIIAPFFAGSATKGSGNIDMTASQISSLSATAGIFIFTNGSLNVGKSTFFANESQISSTGIFTAAGGDIDIYANDDVNVNESRIMSFRGGDITVWSDSGNINAGRGSKTAVNASPPSMTLINGQFVLAFSPPAVGSGIRAVTYDPGWGLPTPPAGDIYMFAPQGVIDAGEAGIAGRNVILGAVQVLNANNIIFSAGSVGVPVSSGGLAGLGTLSGTGSVTQDLKSQEAALTSAAGSKLAPGASDGDTFSAASLEVRVLSFFDVAQADSSWEDADN
ncbi:MAG: filamentous hemagglutinin family protein [Syntrophobacteraceae bacterium]|jgi:filamentous hemagglutinin family protein